MGKFNITWGLEQQEIILEFILTLKWQWISLAYSLLEN